MEWPAAPEAVLPLVALEQLTPAKASALISALKVKAQLLAVLVQEQEALLALVALERLAPVKASVLI